MQKVQLESKCYYSYEHLVFWAQLTIPQKTKNSYIFHDIQAAASVLALTRFAQQQQLAQVPQAL